MVSPSVVGAVSAFDQHGDRNALGAFAAVAGMVGPVVVVALRAEGFEDVGYVVRVAWIGRRVRSALVDERLLDRSGVLQAADGAAEDSGRVGGLGLGVHW